VVHRRARRRPRPLKFDLDMPDEPYLAAWRALTPGQRLLRSWRLRRRLKNIQAIHDEKTFPEL
jgi:hypothetical protein